MTRKSFEVSWANPSLNVREKMRPPDLFIINNANMAIEFNTDTENLLSRSFV